MENEKLEEIELFVEYGVSQEDKESALTFIKKYQKSDIHLTLFKEYYSSLPEAREEPITKVVLIDSVQGTFLLGVASSQHAYLYCADFDSAVLLGEYDKGMKEQDALLFFGFESNEKFLASLKPIDEYQEFVGPSQNEDGEICAICSAKECEFHVFGCTVEVCPWCEGQLSKCNCRFEKLEVDELLTEDELEKLEELLSDKGRIPFEKGQGLAYPVAGDDTLD